MEDEELLPPPPKKVISNKVEEDLLPPPPKKKISGTPSLQDIGQDFGQVAQSYLQPPSLKLTSTSKSEAATKPKLTKETINPFTASIEDIRAVYGEDYNKEQQLNRQKNYTKGLDRAVKSFTEKLPIYEQGLAELEEIDAQLENLKQDPNQYNQAVQVRNQKAKDLIAIADQMKSERVKADIYEKGLSAVDILRRQNEDTAANSIEFGLNQLGIMGTTMIPAMARGAKLINSYIESTAMGLDPEAQQAYIEAQGKIAQKDWKGLTDVAKKIYEKNQILEGGFAQKSGFENIKEGDYKEAGAQLGKELLRNLPVTLGIGLSMYANPLAGAAYTIGGTAGSEMLDMDINNPQMSEQGKVANAFIKGGSEYVTEKVFGTFNYLGRIAGGSLKSKQGKKVVLGTVKSAYEEVAKRMGISADVAEEVSTEVLNKLVGDYTDYVTGKTSEVDFKKGLGETITTAISTSLLLGGTGRAVKYGKKKIDDLREKSKSLQATLEDPNIKPEIADAIKEQVLNVNAEIGNEAAKAKEMYDAMPLESQQKVDALVEEKQSTQELLKDPELPLEVKPDIENKVVELQSEIDNEYKNVDKELIQTEDQKLEQIVSESEKTPIEENKTATDVAPTSNINNEISTLSSVEEDNLALKDETPILNTPKKLSSNGLQDLEIVSSKEANEALESEIGGDKGVIDNNVRTIPIQEYDVPSNRRSKQIAEQIEENGWIEPLIVSYDKSGNVYIVEGQHRAAALKELGYDKAPVIVIHEKGFGEQLLKQQTSIEQGKTKPKTETQKIDIQNEKESNGVQKDGSQREKNDTEGLQSQRKEGGENVNLKNEKVLTKPDVGGVKTPSVSNALKDVASTAKALDNIGKKAKNVISEDDRVSKIFLDVDYGDLKWQQSNLSAFNKGSDGKTYITDKENNIYQISKTKLSANNTFLVTIKDGKNNDVGVFEFRKDVDGEYFAEEAYTSKKGKGIAAIAYDYASKDGEIIKPSKKLKEDGIKFWSKSISEAYHKAKKDGSNPELVKAVEDLLTTKINKENAIQEQSTKKTVSRVGETGENKPESSKGVRPSEQRQETTKQGKEKEVTLNQQTNETEKTEISKAKESTKPTKVSAESTKAAKSKINTKTAKIIDEVLAAEPETKVATERASSRKKALKEVVNEVDVKEQVAVKHILNNLDAIREQLFNKGVITKADCKW